MLPAFFVSSGDNNSRLELLFNFLARVAVPQYDVPTFLSYREYALSRIRPRSTFLSTLITLVFIPVSVR